MVRKREAGWFCLLGNSDSLTSLVSELPLMESVFILLC